MPSAEVPLWVPIVVGLLGVVGVVAGQAITALREDRRWRREQDREDIRWERQKQERTHEAKSAAYAELIGAVESIDFVLYRARAVKEAGQDDLGESLTADLRATTSEARRCLGPVNLHAPERIRSVLRESMLPRFSLSDLLLANAAQKDPGQPRRLWDVGQREYRLLRAEMRRDLGLDAEDLSRNMTDEPENSDTNR